MPVPFRDLRGEEGLGFAVSSARVKEIAQRLISRGSTR